MIQVTQRQQTQAHYHFQLEKPSILTSGIVLCFYALFPTTITLPVGRCLETPAVRNPPCISRLQKIYKVFAAAIWDQLAGLRVNFIKSQCSSLAALRRQPSLQSLGRELQDIAPYFAQFHRRVF